LITTTFSLKGVGVRSFFESIFSRGRLCHQPIFHFIFRPRGVGASYLGSARPFLLPHFPLWKLLCSEAGMIGPRATDLLGYPALAPPSGGMMPGRSFICLSPPIPPPKTSPSLDAVSRLLSRRLPLFNFIMFPRHIETSLLIQPGLHLSFLFAFSNFPPSPDRYNDRYPIHECPVAFQLVFSPML